MIRAASCRLCESEQVLELAAKYKVMVPEELLRARFIEVSEEELGLAYHRVPDEYSPSNCSSLRAKMQQFEAKNPSGTLA